MHDVIAVLKTDFVFLAALLLVIVSSPATALDSGLDDGEGTLILIAIVAIAIVVVIILSLSQGHGARSAGNGPVFERPSSTTAPVCSPSRPCQPESRTAAGYAIRATRIQIVRVSDRDQS